MARRTLVVVVGVLCVLAVAAAAFGAGVWFGHPNYPGDDSAEAGFARDMSTHHHQAVSMAMMEYRNGSDARVRQIAYDIALTQQAQIGIMDEWLHGWGLRQTSGEPAMAWIPGGEDMLLPDGRMPGMASKEEMDTLRHSSGRDADILFCQLMIRHHIGGVHMVDAVLEQSDNADVTELARQMKDAQQYEIDSLKQKLTDMGAKP